MIDIENKVFDTVYTAVIAQYSEAEFLGEYEETPGKFPCITLIQEDSRTYELSQDDSLADHHESVMFECNIYTTGASKKAIAKAIANLVDATMQNMKFTRTFMGQTPNQDRNVYRITMRYEAVVAESVTSGSNTIYQMYRR